jgi:hypothetical protein
MNSGMIPKQRLDIKKEKKKSKYPITDARMIKPENATDDSIYCYEDTLLFQSMTDVALYYNYCRHSFYISMRNNNGYHMGRHFVKYKDLPSDFNFKRVVFSKKEYNNPGSKKIICQYTLNDELKHVYIRKEELPKNMYIANILRVCCGRRNSAYGYKWKILDKKDEFEIFEMIRANQFARFYFAN